MYTVMIVANFVLTDGEKVKIHGKKHLFTFLPDVSTKMVLDTFLLERILPTHIGIISIGYHQWVESGEATKEKADFLKRFYCHETEALWHRVTRERKK